MHYVTCSLLLFVVLFSLITVYHFLLWDSSWSSLSGLRSWVSGFECGFLPQRLTESSFSCTYFILLVFFVVFDLEVSLLLNMPYQGMLYKNLSFYMLFLFFLGVGFGMEINRGYVEWNY